MAVKTEKNGKWDYIARGRERVTGALITHSLPSSLICYQARPLHEMPPSADDCNVGGEDCHLVMRLSVTRLIATLTSGNFDF